MLQDPVVISRSGAAWVQCVGGCVQTSWFISRHGFRLTGSEYTTLPLPNRKELDMAVHNISSTPRTHWEIDPARTSIEFVIGATPLHRVRGRFHGVRGSVVTTGDRASGATAQIEIDAGSIDTGLKIRDAHLRTGQFLDVDRFPTISFTSMQIEDRGWDGLGVTGELTIRGISRQVALEARIEERDGNSARIIARTTLDRRDFKLGPWAMGLTTGNEATVQITLALRSDS